MIDPRRLIGIDSIEAFEMVDARRCAATGIRSDSCGPFIALSEPYQKRQRVETSLASI